MWTVCKLLSKPFVDSNFSIGNSVRSFKVAVIGGSGGIGQALILLLKLNALVTELRVNDLAEHTPGVVEDVSHICTSSKLKGFLGEAEMDQCLEGSDVVVVPAGLPRKPGMSRDELFDSNANVVASVVRKVACVCPNTLLALITNPVNSMVPIAAEIMKAQNVFDPNRLFGVTTLDIVRARKFVGEFMCVDPQMVNIPVIGGHSGITILPIFSQCQPKFQGKENDIKTLTKRIQDAGTEVVKRKVGAGSATLSMGFAGAHFVNALLRGLQGEKGIVECAFVSSDVTELPYFASPIELGPHGLEKNLGLPKLSFFEEEHMKKLMPELKRNIEKGIEYAKK